MACPDNGGQIADGALGLVRQAPRLPARLSLGRASGAVSLLFHAALATLVLTVIVPARAVNAPAISPEVELLSAPRLVFLQTPGSGGGGGGGGHRVQRPPSRAHAPGRDQLTVPGAPAVVVSSPQSVVPSLRQAQQLLLDVTPMASGTLMLAGVPEASAASDLSAGPGSGSGVGDGVGTGIGSGIGSGLGPGNGGGFGDDVYRTGSGVSSPVLIRQVKPKYTDDALRLRIQGTVALDAVVDRDGVPHLVRVARPLDPGLDAEAIAAAREWRFVPGRLGGRPVAVLVVILVDFHVH